ncbi:hypothetical protein E4U43_004956 [Claviceps pusilla]|uniref:Uncharacterized protein n=1 Tax=Claviceps pusilla TaxID=123648 RepID=A0A9P7SUD2_9HYPO|nr:hypothetical protein E4U43_004956 [Claviceps pusilla]
MAPSKRWTKPMSRDAGRVRKGPPYLDTPNWEPELSKRARVVVLELEKSSLTSVTLARNPGSVITKPRNGFCGQEAQGVHESRVPWTC